jgi:outer membrane immunogenic protein
MRREIALAGLFAAMLQAPAMAADVEVAEEPLIYDWSGFYVGAHVGYGEGQVDGEYDSNAFSLEPNGVLGGLHAGYNLQLGSFVIGAEGDFSWVDWADSAAVDTATVSAEVDWLATLRARLGVALDNFLLYGTIGAAWADASASVVDTGPVGSVDFEDAGLVAGGGVEWGINEKLSWKLEGLWFNFDDTSSFTADPADSITLDDAWVVQTGVRFNF